MFWHIQKYIFALASINLRTSSGKDFFEWVYSGCDTKVLQFFARYPNDTLFLFSLFLSLFISFYLPLSFSVRDREPIEARRDPGSRSSVWILFVAPFALVAAGMRSRDHVARSRKLEPTFTWRRLVGPGPSFSPSISLLSLSPWSPVRCDVFASRVHWFRFEEIDRVRELAFSL